MCGAWCSVNWARAGSKCFYLTSLWDWNCFCSLADMQISLLDKTTQSNSYYSSIGVAWNYSSHIIELWIESPMQTDVHGRMIFYPGGRSTCCPVAQHDSTWCLVGAFCFAPERTAVRVWVCEVRKSRVTTGFRRVSPDFSKFGRVTREIWKPAGFRKHAKPYRRTFWCEHNI